MRIHTMLIATLALALATAGCSKNKADEGETSAGETESGSKATEESGGDTAGETEGETGSEAEEPEGDEPQESTEVAAATADDLARFTEDLEGEGKLMATLETSMGTFHCELYEEGAPLTVANFVGLATGKLPWRDPKSGEVAERPFYDGLTFHRVIPNFMIQGGCPLGTGTGDPGFRFDTEVSEDLRHDKPGILSTANSGPNTNGSQFFITEKPTPHLDGKHNVFGHCKETDLVKKITGVPTAARNKPKESVILERVVIHRGEK